MPLAVQHFNMAVLLTTPPTVAVPASSGQDTNEPSPFEPTAEMCDRACEHYRTAIELIEAETETEAHVEQAQAIFLDASKSSLLMAACYNLALLLRKRHPVQRCAAASAGRPCPGPRSGCISEQPSSGSLQRATGGGLRRAALKLRRAESGGSDAEEAAAPPPPLPPPPS